MALHKIVPEGLNQAIGSIRCRIRIRQTGSRRLHLAVWQHALLHPERLAGLAGGRDGAASWREEGGTMMGQVNSRPTCMMLRLPPRRSISGNHWVGSPSNVSLFRHGRMRDFCSFRLPSPLSHAFSPAHACKPCPTSLYDLPVPRAMLYFANSSYQLGILLCALLHGIYFFLSLALQQTGTYLSRVAPARTCNSRL